MAQFVYRARRSGGEVIEGVIEASDRTGAVARLRSQGLFPVSLTPTTASGAAASEAGSRLRWPFRRRQRKPRLQEIVRYTEQLANLLEAGMPLTMALQSMSQLGSKGLLSEVSLELRREIMEGRSLSEAMARQPHIFSELYVNMVRAGEQSGALTEVLHRLAAYYAQFAELRQQIISAMVYPAIVLVVGVGVMTFFLTKLLPSFMVIFEGMDIPLPWSTRVVVGISHFLTGYWWLLLLIGIAGWILFRRWAESEAGRRKLDQWKLTAPILGRVTQCALFSQFARTLATLLQNGVPVLNALRITEQVIPNSILREAIRQTRDEVTDGKTISQPLQKSGVFPQLLIDLVRIGEETGDMPGALHNAAQNYERDLTIALKMVTDAIGPAMIILLAIIIGFLVFSVLSAMFKISANIAR